MGSVGTSVSNNLNFESSEFSNWYNELSSNEQDSLYNYALDSTRLNNQLRNDTKLDSSYEAIVENLDASIDKHSLSKDVTVYRGVGTDYLGLDLSSESNIKKLVGKTIKDSAYMSTSLQETIGQTYGRGAVLKIKVPKGTKVASPELAYVRGDKSKFKELSQSNDSNHELLLGRNTQLKITGYTKKTHNGNTYYELQAELKRRKSKKKK